MKKKNNNSNKEIILQDLKALAGAYVMLEDAIKMLGDAIKMIKESSQMLSNGLDRLYMDTKNCIERRR